MNYVKWFCFFCQFVVGWCWLNVPIFKLYQEQEKIVLTFIITCKTWCYKDCSRNCKNPVLYVIRTLGTSNQAIYYNLLSIYFSFVNRFRYINNNVTNYRCSIPIMDTTVRLGCIKFSLRATIDHHGPSIHTGHYTASINCCKKNPFYCNGHTITEFRIIDSKNSSTAYVILYELIETCFLESNRRVGVWSLPRRWHILSIPLTTGRGTGAETCGLDDVFLPDDLCSRPEALC